jgi:hypothetical protein
MEGEIRDVRFLGGSREYLIRLANGDTVVARRFLEGLESSFRAGEKVSVGFRQGDVMLFAYPPQGLRNELEMA